MKATCPSRDSDKQRIITLIRRNIAEIDEDDDKDKRLLSLGRLHTVAANLSCTVHDPENSLLRRSERISPSKLRASSMTAP